MDFSQITIYDFFTFGIIFIIFTIVLLLGLLAKNGLRIILFSVATLLFIAMPFLNIIVMDNFINKNELIIRHSKKLSYINTFFIDGEIVNKGKKTINHCRLFLYINTSYLLQKPEYIIMLNNMNLKVGATYTFSKMLDNFNYGDEYKEIHIRCF